MSLETIPVTFAMALPNNRMAEAVIDPKGQPQMVMPHLLQLPPQTTALLRKPEQVIWFPKPDDAPRPMTGPVINICADFDTYSLALRSMSKWFSSETTIFNHPTAIAALTNNEFIQRIVIEGLKIPKAIRFFAQKPDDFEASFAKGEFAYPVRIQLASDASSSSILVIKSKDDWNAARRLDWPSKWFNMVQLEAEDLKQHLRYRICFVGSQAELTAFPFAPPPGNILKEVKLPFRTDGDVIRDICAKLAKHIKLDFWTAEFSSQGKSSLKLEHLWVGLPMKAPEDTINPSATLWPKIAPQLNSLVKKPTQWRNWQKQGQRKSN